MSGVPAQRPGSAVSVSPSRGVPSRLGAAVLIGGAGSTASVRPEVAVAVPPRFVAVTRTRSSAPTSPGPAV
jgi:hypothetical protein